MSEYAVVWRDSAEPGHLWAGGCTASAQGFFLRGSNGYEQETLAVEKQDVVDARRAVGGERIAGYPSLLLQLRAGRALVVASVMGAGIVAELLDALSGGAF